MSAPRPPSPARRRWQSSRWWWLAVPLVALAIFASTPFGGWMQSFFFGSGVRWQEAYSALEAAESNLPRDPRERERMLLAWAQTESEPPIGMAIGPRLHPAGTLARLRYEIQDGNGERLQAWEVRALVPTIGNGEGPFWREHCNRACAEELTRAKGFRLQRSGEPGIASGWVLRMPVGETFELSATPLHTQDILDATPRSVPIMSVRSGKEPLQRPAKIFVTLVDACPAMVRVGTAMNLELAPNAIIPIPTGFSISRWAQLDGCGALAPLPPPEEQLRVYATPDIPEAPDLRSIVVRRDAASGHADLIVDEAWLHKHNMPVVFHVATICRYDAGANRWERLPPADPGRSWRLVPLTPTQAGAGNRVAYELPRETALFWLYWSEQNEVNPSARSVRWRDALVVAGRVLCNDIDLGPAPEGQAAACVPFADHAEARFVPAPAKACAS